MKTGICGDLGAIGVLSSGIKDDIEVFGDGIVEVDSIDSNSEKKWTYAGFEESGLNIFGLRDRGSDVGHVQSIENSVGKDYHEDDDECD